MDEYEYTYRVSVCDVWWYELYYIDVPRHGSLFNAVHAVLVGHYDIEYHGNIVLTRDITPTGLGMSIYEPNHVMISYHSIIDYSTMSDNTDSDEDVM